MSQRTTETTELLRSLGVVQRRELQRVRIIGVSNESLIDEIKSQLPSHLTVSASMETQQQDAALREEAVMDMFVFKPKQTGFGAVAQMTAAAIRNPETTTLVVLDGTEEVEPDPEESREVAQLLETLKATDAPVFTTVSSAVAHVNTVADNGLDEVSSIVG